MCIVLIAYLYSPYIAGLVCVVKLHHNYVYLMHYTYIIFLLYSFNAYTNVYTLWDLNQLLSLSLDLNITTYYGALFALNTNSVEVITYNLNFLGTVLSDINFFINSTSQDINSFRLVFSGTNSLQALVDGLFFKQFLVKVSDSTLVPLLSLLILILYSVRLGTTRQPYIIF